MRSENLRDRQLRAWLREIAPDGLAWDWLSEDGTPMRRLSKKRANKFLLGCSLDYQVKADVAWSNAERLAEEVFGDPLDLWEPIARHSASRWMSRRNAMKWLHRFPAAHMRVWKIARGMVVSYRGDARNIWRGRTPDEAKQRFLNLGLGNQISRMAVGALLDSRQVRGTGDVKADVHVCRVLGRLLTGTPLSPADATAMSRRAEKPMETGCTSVSAREENLSRKSELP